MFQVLATIFFSIVSAVAFGVIAAMLLDNGVEIRSALGLNVSGSHRASWNRSRRMRRVEIVRPRVVRPALRHAAA
jgi:hypothetical protein